MRCFCQAIKLPCLKTYNLLEALPVLTPVAFERLDVDTVYCFLFVVKSFTFLTDYL